MRKKKQLAAFMLLTAMLLNLTACVKTPEENIVTDKSKGLSEENIIPKEKDGKEKQLNIPEHWKETITRKDGFITVYDLSNCPIPDYPNCLETAQSCVHNSSF